MPLPKLNTPEYSLNVPSSDEEIKYRPFVVAEEKLLLIAQETGDEDSMLNAVKQIVEGCTFNNLDVEHMPLFDLEYIFLNIRAKSVGETATIKVKCPDDEKTEVEVEIFLPDVKVEIGEDHDNKIKLTDSMMLEMTYPRFDTVTNLKKQYPKAGDVEMTFHMIASTMMTLYDGEEEYDMMDETHDEKMKFIDQMTQMQFSKMQKFFETSPKLTHTINVTNPKTKKKGKYKLEGIAAFF
tara:strand:- start:2237 stop:2950 length:714 start_codon:yes stop_codon:yes gene_type:complete